MKQKKVSWHEGGVIYQIYPRSFADASGEGIGDLRGIISHLDYLGGKSDSLAVTAIWISPIYLSPMADFGYDVADYTAVDPIFGTISDFKALLEAAHQRDMKVILDFVPNHTSEEHPWFIESKRSVTSPKRDWYTWHQGSSDTHPPNNWRSVFGGPAWEFSETTNEYYLHSFLKQQPDLNWDNPEVREAMKGAMRFWLDMGVDGFRVDAVDWLSKDRQLRDDVLKDGMDIDGLRYDDLEHHNSREGSDLFMRLNEMADVLDEYTDRFMITEAHPETQNKIQGYLEYYRTVNPRLSAPFNFEGIYLPWEAARFRSFVDSFQSGMKDGYTPIYTLGNHDESRIASRIGEHAARTAAMMLLTLPGLAFIYYGDELGMKDGSIAADEIRDPFSIAGKGRDPQRTPMQWDDSLYAGFSQTKPWLPVSTDTKSTNVANQAADPSSLLSLYRRLLRMRTQSLILKYGSYRSLNLGKNIFAYERSYHGRVLIIVLNFSKVRQHITAPGLRGNVILSSYGAYTQTTILDSITLLASEGIIIAIEHD